MLAKRVEIAQKESDERSWVIKVDGKELPFHCAGFSVFPDQSGSINYLLLSIPFLHLASLSPVSAEQISVEELENASLKDLCDTLEASWVEAFGSKQDPEVQKQIQQTAQRLQGTKYAERLKLLAQLLALGVGHEQDSVAGE